jgi:hypothetical protein
MANKFPSRLTSPKEMLPEVSSRLYARLMEAILAKPTYPQGEADGSLGALKWIAEDAGYVVAGLARPPASFLVAKVVKARHKAGHDASRAVQRRWVRASQPTLFRSLGVLIDHGIGEVGE